MRTAVFDVFLLYYEMNVLGLPGSLAGLSVFIAMCCDALSDPFIGSLSDHLRSRWGRRHPFMYAAAIPTPLFFYLLLSPPEGLGTVGLFTWLTVMSVLVRISLALHQIPSGALAPEITADYDERTTLSGFRFLFAWAGALGLGMFAWVVVFPRFADGRHDPAAYGPVGIAAAVIVFVSILACALGTHRLIPRLRHPDSDFSLAGFRSDIGNAVRNDSYRMILLAASFGAVAVGFNEAFSLYLGTYFWEFDDGEQALMLGGGALAIPIAIVIARRVSVVWDKRRALLGLLSFVVLTTGLPVYARLLGLMPPNGDPMVLVIVAVHMAIVATASISVLILLSSMVQDTVDENELETGERQEGVFGASLAFVGKAVSGVGNLLGGIAVQLIDIPVRAAPGSIPQSKVDLLGWAVGPGIMLFYGLALPFVRRYRITRERHREILGELARRAAGRASIPAS